MAEDNTVRLVPRPGFEKGEALSLSEGERSRRKPRRRLLAASFLLCVLLPALLAAAYYAFIASDRYVAGAGFAVRGMDSSMGTDFLGAFTGLANVGSTASDSYILLEFLESRDLVEKLERAFPLQAAYSGPVADFLYRLDPELDIEHRVEYWADRIHTTFDNNSGIVTFRVEAFRPEDAARIAELVLSYCKTLVNELSASARADAVAYAEGEVERAEARLRAALEELRRFRVEENALDPGRIAQLQIEIVGGLEKELAETRARISALQGAVDSNSPAMRTLRRHAEALEKEIADMNVQASQGGSAEDPSALSGLLAAYETLEVERNFAQQAYTSALSSLERARVEADRQQRYLAVYSQPLVPEYPLYPRRLLNSLLILAALALVWGIGALVAYSVRDHVS
ncbi:lipopolysaccharide biosynthesis protein [Chelativorans sp. AA-79]|uniref:lipopolysaccharide biosynthesis protein n=1 Tax=Chelativorans sp. AA-79 TaxID=3028735 RepID=UPI0023F9A753|nr:lipopolysaccharide biosynthesis protein [Chelativorans sp. AA-79]WEX10246.1 lipopolysaccharide biosynthesis protein [Chelativorans sp. AA-79]